MADIHIVKAIRSATLTISGILLLLGGIMIREGISKMVLIVIGILALTLVYNGAMMLKKVEDEAK